MIMQEPAVVRVFTPAAYLPTYVRISTKGDGCMRARARGSRKVARWFGRPSGALCETFVRIVRA